VVDQVDDINRKGEDSVKIGFKEICDVEVEM
jgi:hypothetical protein